MSNNSWKEKFSFLAPQGVEHEVQGETHTFYPISVKALFMIKDIARLLAGALAALFPDKAKDVGAKYEYANDPNTLPGKERLLKMETEGLSAQMGLLRSDQQEKAILGIIDATTDPNNAIIIGRLLVDSMRDDFERGSMNNKDVAEFMESLPLPALKDMLIGLAKANAKVLGPLEEKVSRIIDLAINSRLTDFEQRKPEASVLFKKPETKASKASKETTG